MVTKICFCLFYSDLALCFYWNTSVLPSNYINFPSVSIFMAMRFKDSISTFPFFFLSESMGHAMAETPAGVARALLYIVRASPTFFHQSINHSYIPYLSSGYEPGRRAYSLKKHSIVLYTPTIVYLVPPQVCRPQKSERQNATWPRYNNDHQPSAINHQPATKCYSITFSS